MDRLTAKPREYFKHFTDIQTRWSDNDQFGHINNPVYNMWFDTVVNNWMIESFGHKHLSADFLALVVETQCAFFHELSYPETVEIGLICTKIGRSSVNFEIGVFRKGNEQSAATGRFVQVIVARDGKKPIEIPAKYKMALEIIN